MDKIKYQKSKSGVQCIGPCFKAGATLLHPISLQYVSANQQNFCAINPTTDPKIIKHHAQLFNIKSSDISSKLKLGQIAPCYAEDNNLYDDAKLFDLENIKVVVPTIEISCGDFLQIFYGIYSIENTLQWIEQNKNVPKTTKNRLINCSWKQFGSDKNNITDIFVEYYYNIISNKWIHSFYEYLYKYLSYDVQNKIVVLAGSVQSKTEYKDKKIKYIIKNIYNFNSIQNIMFDFIDIYSSKWLTIESHQKIIKKLFFEYGMKKLNKK